MIQPILNKFIALEVLNRRYFKIFNVLRYAMVWGSIPCSLIVVLMYLNFNVGVSILLILGGWFTVAYVVGNLSSTFLGILFLFLVVIIMSLIELKILYLNDTLKQYTDIVENLYEYEEVKFNEIAEQEKEKEKETITNIPIIKRRIN